MTDVKIKCDSCKFVDGCVDYGWSECKKFTQKPSEPMTEQEYLQTCTTEHLANAFFEYRYINATPRQKLWMSASEKCIKTDIAEWLKQTHNNA
jgi:hypothetical protein